MLAHQDGDMRVMQEIACEMRQLDEDLPATSAWRWVATRTEKPGEASSAVTNSHAAAVLQGRRITRGWVVTRKNSYRIPPTRIPGIGPRPLAFEPVPAVRWNGESASAA